MTILPGDGSYSGAPTPPKRLCLSLKQHRNNIAAAAASSSSGTQSASSSSVGQDSGRMESMTGIQAFFPPSQRTGLFNKYDVEPSRSSTTDDSPASEATSSSERNAGPSVMATLANLGNTCFLNSVLYTLRFVPQFMHQLHHLVTELGSLKNQAETEVLTRPQLTQLAVERLHELYQALRGNEDSKEYSIEPLHPSVFIDAFREVNPMFENHQQHDAHELLVSLLDNVRDTCLLLQQLREQRKAKQVLEAANVKSEPGTSEGKGSSSRSGGFRAPWKGRKSKSKNKEVKKEEKEEQETSSSSQVDPPDPNFIAKDFEGVTVLRTTCLECESATERKETFCDICVPIQPSSLACEDGNGRSDDSAVFHEALLSSELISGSTNKYWCEECKHQNEARRNTRYQTLPRILTLQLKRFSSSFGSIFSVSKVNDYMPTPLTLRCFCESCFEDSTAEGASTSSASSISGKHLYQLVAAIMHVGSTMASGHYVAYVKANENHMDYIGCESLLAATNAANHSSGGSGILKFLKPKAEKVIRSYLGAEFCAGTDCCGIKLNVEPGSDSAVPEPYWLECDDDNVAVLTRSEFENILSQKHAKNSTLTPYLLFYVRSC